jgi:regulator of protease activity HflC (stomatin/prohibitin superfamily)
MILTILLILFVLFLLWKFQNYFIIIPPKHIAIIERFGHYSKQIGPGFHFIVPYIEHIHRVHWSYIEQHGRKVNVNEYIIPSVNNQMDVPPIQCTSKDEMQVIVDVTLFYTIVDIKTAAYDTPDALNLFYHSCIQAIRSQISTTKSAEGTFGDTLPLAALIQERIGTKCGLECTKVLIQRIEYVDKEIVNEKQRIRSKLKTQKALFEIEQLNVETASLRYKKLLEQGFTNEQIIQLEQASKASKIYIGMNKNKFI